MLCACEPVKYCMAAPKQDGSTTRKSTCRPPDSRTVARVSPCAATWVTSPNLPNRSMTAAGLEDVTTMSRSPIVSLRRRKLPATAISSMSPPALQVVDDRARVLLGFMQHDALVPLAAGGGGHALANFLEQLGAEARQLGDLARLERSFEIRDAVHFQLVVEQLHTLGPQVRDAKQVEQPRRNRGDELLALWQRAGLHERGDFLCDAAADAGQVGEVELPTAHQLVHRVGMICDRSGGVAIRPYLERIACRDFQEVGDLAEQAGDFGVLHRLKLVPHLLAVSHSA